MIPGFPFDEIDLVTNQRGELTDRQLRRVEVEYQRRLRLTALLLAIGPPVVILAVTIAIENDLLDPLAFRTLVAAVYVITILLILPLIGVGMWSTYIKPIRNRTPHAFSGRIRLKPKGEDIHLQFGSRWFGPRFAISPDQAEHLVAGDTYTVYFTPGGSRSLFHSMEHVFIPVSDEEDEEEDEEEDKEDEEGADGEDDDREGQETAGSGSDSGDSHDS